uniref:Uncharacterized protein n=1 Tax=viral metagenome TaxID=1070528 RepID=A0A6C0DL33_9ZZZZ
MGELMIIPHKTTQKQLQQHILVKLSKPNYI